MTEESIRRIQAEAMLDQWENRNFPKLAKKIRGQREREKHKEIGRRVADHIDRKYKRNLQLFLKR